MNDETLFDKPGVELDAEMAQRILDDGDGYSERIIELAQFIREYKGRFREELLKNNYIQTASSNIDGFDLAAVDGASAVKAHGGGSLVAAAAYKSTINEEKQRGVLRDDLVPNSVDVASFATLLRLHLELSLLTSNKLDSDNLVILDHSFWGVMQGVSRALAAYKTRRGELLGKKRDPETDAMQIAWYQLFHDCLSNDGSFLAMMRNKQVISLSKTGISQFFVHSLLGGLADKDPRAFALGTVLNDRALLRHVLRPGEYTTPQSLYRVTQESGDIKSWKRSRFATAFEEKHDGPDPFEARTQVLNEYGVPTDDAPLNELTGRRLFVTYYVPHERSRAYRIEFHEAMLSNKDAPKDLTGQGDRFQRLLASIRRSVDAETKEPLCQVLADERAKTAVATAISLLPERAFYQLRDKYRNSPEMVEVIDTLLSEERT